MKKLSLYVALALLLSAFSFCRNSNKQNEEVAKESNENKQVMNEDQSDFLVEAASGGMMEVEVAKLAVDKALNPKVKDFAKMMVTDHEQLNRELKDLATKKQITLPAMMDTDQQKDINDLRKLNGPDFDRKFMEMMEDDHEREIKKFEDASENHTDNDVQVFAAKTLPKLRAHLDAARMVRNTLK